MFVTDGSCSRHLDGFLRALLSSNKVLKRAPVSDHIDIITAALINLVFTY